MKKVYGVYYGCLYEGGGVGSPLYVDKEQAINACKKLVKKEQRDHRNQFNRSEKNEFDIRYFQYYRWRKTTGLENDWNNTVDCVSLQEFDII